MPSTPHNLLSAQRLQPPALLRVAWIVAVALLPCARAQEAPRLADPEALLAAFVYNFCLFTDWPATIPGAGDQNFVLAVAGQPLPAFAALSKRKVAKRPVRVVQLGATDAIPESCDALFCQGLTQDRQRDLLAQAAQRPILTLSSDPGFCQAGGIVEFFLSGRHMRFRVSLPNLNRTPLRIASRLLQLAGDPSAPAAGGAP